MYLEEENIETGVLRQGDIVSQMHILGALNPGTFNFISDSKGNKVSWSVQYNDNTIGDAVILSHSCEIDPKNSVKLTSIILAPIRDINTATEKEKIKDVIESNIIISSSKHSYLKYFYLTPNKKLQYSDGAICDFSKCFSIRKNYYNQLIEKKVLQLNPKTTEAFSFKLALYFYRNSKISVS